jgi:hypothetical protein
MGVTSRVVGAVGASLAAHVSGEGYRIQLTKAFRTAKLSYAIRIGCGQGEVQRISGILIDWAV